MTKYTTLSGSCRQRKTIFKKRVCLDSIDNVISSTPDNYDNIVYLGNDVVYGDVFKAFDNGSNNFTIFFGDKGFEFE